ncbi:MAG: phosphotransferase [Actinomycetales bacterium]
MARSALTLAALADAAVPGLLPVSARGTTEAGADFDSAVVTDDQDRQWVVRAPATNQAGVLLEAELALLRSLRSEGLSLPFAVPDPRATVELPDGGRAVVYPFLPGEPLHPGDLAPGPGLAASLGTALAAVHELPTSVATDLGVPSYTAEEYRTRRLLELDQAAGSGQVPSRLLTRWERALEDVSRWRFTPCLVHGDLVAEHVLVSGGTVTGIANWGEAKIADPADDLAWLAVGADEPALDSVVEAYAVHRKVDPDRHLVVRARMSGELALARWLMHGIHTDDPLIVADAVAMLDDLAKDVGDDPL